MDKIRLVAFLISILVWSVHIYSQEYHGITGLIQTPCAETDSSGTFYGSISWIDKAMLPVMSDFNDGQPFSAPCYTIGITGWTWIQLSYSATIVKIHPNGDESKPLGFYNEDRHVNLKLRPIIEGKWWPAIALGMDDIGRFNLIIHGDNHNNHFQNFYIAGSKHFDIHGSELGTHMAYRYYTEKRNRKRTGVSGGITLRPAFYRPLRFIAEWDGCGVNAGADVTLWRHLFVQAALVHGRGFSASLGYHYTIHF